MLTCVSGPEEGLGLTLTEGVYGIGRGRDNHFVLKDIAASRQHVEVRVQRGEVTVFDLGSGNGTRINGKRMQQATLQSGDRIEIGNSALTFTALGISSASKELSLVPPKPAPRPQDLWPETETLLSELKEFESRVGGHPRVVRREGAPQGAAAAPAVRPGGPAVAQFEASASLAEIRNSIGGTQRVGSNVWLFGGAALIILLLVGAALIVYLTYIRPAGGTKASALAVQGSMVLAQGDYQKARGLIDEALRLDPENVEAKKTLDLVVRIQQSEQAFQRYEELLKTGSFEEARHALEGIQEGTPRFGQVEDLRVRVDRAEADACTQEARKLVDRGELADADRLISKALRVNPGNALATSLKKQLEEAKTKVLKPVAPLAEAPPEEVKPEVEKAAPKVSSSEKKKKKKKKKKRTSTPRRLSDNEARTLLRDAITAFKVDNLSKSRRLCNKILRGTEPGSKYHKKAQSFIDRRL